MTTPFETFVNAELPKRVSTEETPGSWAAGKVLMTTGVGNGVEAVDATFGGGIAGDWDMTATGGTILTPSVALHFTVSGSGPYTLTPETGGTYQAVTSSAVAGDGSIGHLNNVANMMTNDPMFIYFGFMNAEMSLSDLEGLFNGEAPPTGAVTGVVGSTFIAGSDDIFTGFVFTPAGGMSPFDVTDNKAHTIGQALDFKLNVVLGDFVMSAKTSADSTWHEVGTIPAASAPTGMKPYIIPFYGAGYTTDVTGVDLGSYGGSAVAPADPVDKRFVVTVGGTYLGQSANVGDIVEFLTLTDIFVTRDINLVLGQVVLPGDISNLQGQITAIDSTVDGHTTELSTLSGDLSTLAGTVGELQGSIGSLVVQNHTPDEYTGVINIDLAASEVTGSLHVVTWSVLPSSGYAFSVSIGSSTAQAVDTYVQLVFPYVELNGVALGDYDLIVTDNFTSPVGTYVCEAKGFQQILLKVEGLTIKPVYVMSAGFDLRADSMNFGLNDIVAGPVGVDDGGSVAICSATTERISVIINEAAPTGVTIQLAPDSGERLPTLRDRLMHIAIDNTDASASDVNFHMYPLAAVTISAPPGVSYWAYDWQHNTAWRVYSV